MKTLLSFLIISISCITLGQQPYLHVDFFLKKNKADANKSIIYKSVVHTDINGRAKISNDIDQNFALAFKVEELNPDEVRVTTELFDNNKLIAKPIMIINYDHRGIIEINNSISSSSDSIEFCLAIIPSKKNIKSSISENLA